MHKKLAARLTSIAHDILQMKNKEDVFALKQKAHEVYEKLSVLAYVEEYLNTTPNATETKEELIANIEKASEEIADTHENEIEESLPVEVAEPMDSAQEEPSESKKTEDIFEQPLIELEEKMSDEDFFTKDDVKDVGEKKVFTLEEELQDTISVDVAADMFEKVTPKKSLHDKLQSNIQIGLNDRITFVKNLFDGNQEDFNRVISQLNTFKTEKEARKFINKMVKPDYNWAENKELEERFMAIIERKFA